MIETRNTVEKNAYMPIRSGCTVRKRTYETPRRTESRAIRNQLKIMRFSICDSSY
jgi:hypothetical protein